MEVLSLFVDFTTFIETYNEIGILLKNRLGAFLPIPSFEGNGKRRKDEKKNPVVMLAPRHGVDPCGDLTTT